MKKLRADQARKLRAAELEVVEAKGVLAAAQRRRDEIRERLSDLVKPGKTVEAGGIQVKRIVKTTGRKFRLKAYLEKHKLTKPMEEYVTESSTYEVWDVKEAPAEDSS